MCVQEDSHGANGHSGAQATPEDLTSDYQEEQDEDEQPKAGLPIAQVLPSHRPVALCSQAFQHTDSRSSHPVAARRFGFVPGHTRREVEDQCK